MSGSDKVLSCLGSVVVLIGFTIAGTILNGWVLSILWGWFIVPEFSLPPLGVAEAIAVAMIVSYLTYQSQPSDENKPTEDKLIEAIAIVIFKPLFALFVGWILLQFIGS